MPTDGLASGSLVDVIAPGFRPERAKLKTGIEFLKSLGLKVRVGENVWGHHYLCAAPHELRLKDFKKAWQATDSQIIWCARGGYGSSYLLPWLTAGNWSQRQANKKLIVGFSDITSLLNATAMKHNSCGWHALSVEGLGDESLTASRKILIEALRGQRSELSYRLKALNSSAMKVRKVSGRLLGGNLTVFQSLMAYDFGKPDSDAILFFEEVGERAYRVDRLLQQLKSAGFVDAARAIVFGDFVRCNEPNKRNLIPRVLREFAQQLKVPVYSGLPVGHGLRQMPLIVGGRVELNRHSSQDSQVILTQSLRVRP